MWGAADFLSRLGVRDAADPGAGSLVARTERGGGSERGGYDLFVSKSMRLEMSMEVYVVFLPPFSEPPLFVSASLGLRRRCPRSTGPSVASRAPLSLGGVTGLMLLVQYGLTYLLRHYLSDTATPGLR